MAANDPHTTPQPPEKTPEGGELSEYEVDDGSGGTYTVQLTQADAEARGLTGKTAAPAAGAPAESGTDDDTGTASKAAPAPANKRRPASNK